MRKGFGGELVAFMIDELEWFALGTVGTNLFLSCSPRLFEISTRIELVGIQTRMRISRLGNRIGGLRLLNFVSLGGRVSDVPTVGPGT